MRGPGEGRDGPRRPRGGRGLPLGQRAREEPRELPAVKRWPGGLAVEASVAEEGL